MKTSFFGTSDRSIPILESLKNNTDLQLCVTKKDTLIGRDQIIRQTEVKKWCQNNGIKVIEIDGLKSPSLEVVIEKLISSKIDLVLVADFSYIIPEKLLNTFLYKFINLHFSLLPKYRGASPVQRAILNGDTKTGVTFQLIAPAMDKGDIIKQFEYNIVPGITSGNLYGELFGFASNLIPDVLNDYYNGHIKPYQQDESQASYTSSPTNPKSTLIYKEDALINWDKYSPQEIERMVRAYNPWPIAWTYLKNLKTTDKIYGFPQGVKLKTTVNDSLSFKFFKSEMKEGKILPQEVQLQNKAKTDWKSFINGYCEK